LAARSRSSRGASTTGWRFSRRPSTTHPLTCSYQERVEKEFLQTLWDDLEIWRYQIYIENPALAQQDARPYGALRKWAKQFYELEPIAQSSAG
jgi:hypothetical protein